MFYQYQSTSGNMLSHRNILQTLAMDSTTPLKRKVPGAIPSDDDFFSNKNTRFSGFFPEQHHLLRRNRHLSSHYRSTAFVSPFPAFAKREGSNHA